MVRTAAALRVAGTAGLRGDQAYEEIRPIVLFGSPMTERARETGKPEAVGGPRLFEVPRALPQPRLFALDTLGEGGWLKVMRLEGYAPRSPHRPEGLQQALFAHHEVWG